MNRLKQALSRINCYRLGIRDGLKNDLGITWEDDDSKNESYDAGANVGETIARVFELPRLIKDHLLSDDEGEIRNLVQFFPEL